MPRIVKNVEEIIDALDIKNISEVDVLNKVFAFIKEVNNEQPRVNLYPIIYKKKWAISIELKGLVSNIATAPRYTWLVSSDSMLVCHWLNHTDLPEFITFDDYRFMHKTLENAFRQDIPLWDKKI